MEQLENDGALGPISLLKGWALSGMGRYSVTSLVAKCMLACCLMT